MIKKVLAKFYEVIPTQIDNVVCCRFLKDFINSERSLVMIFTYVHPQNSPWYQHVGLNCDIVNIDTCISNVLQVYGEVDFMLCGDLNSRTGNSNPCQSHDLDELWKETDEHDFPRNSKDATTNQFGNYLLDLCKVFDFVILNGLCRGDEEGNFTYITTSGSSVIDYFIISDSLMHLNMQLKVAEEMLSQHLPVELVIRNDKAPETEEQILIPEQEVSKIKWDSQKKDQFKEAEQSIESRNILKEATNLINLDLERAIERFTSYLLHISNCMIQTFKVRGGRKQDPTWYDKECSDKKKDTRKHLRKYRKTRADEDRLNYCRMRKEYKALQKEKRIQFQRDQLHNIISAKDDMTKFWTAIRKVLRKPQPTPNISLGQWREHFETLLNVPTAQEAQENNNIQDEGDTGTAYCETTDKPITDEEIMQAIRHLKSNKASGWDGIPAELLKEAEIVPFLRMYLNTLLEAGIFPKFWSKSIIVPIFKKGDPDKPTNYRGV